MKISNLPENIKYHAFNASDHEKYKIIKNNFKESCEFIEKAKNDNNSKILVHCVAGQNRSACIVVAYCAEKQNMTLIDAIEYVSSKRHGILMNRGFRHQLIQYFYDKKNIGHTQS